MKYPQGIGNLSDLAVSRLMRQRIPNPPTDTCYELPTDVARLVGKPVFSYNEATLEFLGYDPGQPGGERAAEIKGCVDEAGVMHIQEYRTLEGDS